MSTERQPVVAPEAARALARLAKQVDLALAPLDLSGSQYRVLVFLDEVDAAAASALADRLAVSRPSVTALVDGLEARGLVRRRSNAGDRRRVEVQLTPAGEHALDLADRAIADRLVEVTSHLDADGRRRAVSGLTAWGTALDRARQQLIAGQA